MLGIRDVPSVNTSTASRLRAWRLALIGTGALLLACNSKPPQTPTPPSPPTVTALNLVPNSLVGGGAVEGTIRLSSQAPSGGLAVSLSSSDSAAVLTGLPQTVTVPAGADRQTFSFSTTPVSSQSQVVVTASLSGSAVTSTLTVESRLPFVVYGDDGDPRNHFVPSGFFGDTGDLTLTTADRTSPHGGATSIRIDYRPRGSMRFAGIFWQNPANNWGTTSGAGFDLRPAKTVQFWARASVGGVKAEFKVGGITGPFPDTLPSTETVPRVVQLSTSWQQFSIDVSARDLSYVIGGFMWVTNATDQNPSGCTIFVDDIVWQ